MGPRLHRKIQDDQYLLLPERLTAKVYIDPYKDSDYSHQAHCWENINMATIRDHITFINRNQNFTMKLTDYSKYHLTNSKMVLSTIMHNDVEMLRPWIEYHKRLGF